MKLVIAVLIAAFVVFKLLPDEAALASKQAPTTASHPLSAGSSVAPTLQLGSNSQAAGRPSRTFACDGRQYCSQMSSCEEATYFLRNCPGVKMDGDGDGIPCESQWCR